MRRAMQAALTCRRASQPGLAFEWTRVTHERSEERRDGVDSHQGTRVREDVARVAHYPRPARLQRPHHIWRDASRPAGREVAELVDEAVDGCVLIDGRSGGEDVADLRQDASIMLRNQPHAILTIRPASMMRPTPRKIELASRGDNHLKPLLASPLVMM